MNINKRMHTNFQCCKVDTSLVDISVLLNQSSLGCVVVVDEFSFPKGIVEKYDIDNFYKLYGHIDFAASDVVHNACSCLCWDQDDVKIAASLMIDRNLTNLPVVNNRFCVVGIIMMSDVLLLHKNSSLPVENVSYHV